MQTESVRKKYIYKRIFEFEQDLAEGTLTRIFRDRVKFNRIK